MSSQQTGILPQIPFLIIAADRLMGTKGGFCRTGFFLHSFHSLLVTEENTEPSRHAYNTATACIRMVSSLMCLIVHQVKCMTGGFLRLESQMNPDFIFSHVCSSHSPKETVTGQSDGIEQHRFLMSDGPPTLPLFLTYKSPPLSTSRQLLHSFVFLVNCHKCSHLYISKL